MLRIGFTVLLGLLASHGAHGYLSFSDVRTILKEKVSVASMHRYKTAKRSIHPDVGALDVFLHSRL